MSLKSIAWGACAGLMIASLGASAAQYSVTNLGTLGGMKSGVGAFSTGSGVGANGQVTGSSVSNEPGNQVHAFIGNATSNALIDLGSLCVGYEGDCSSEGDAVNASGQVTGSSLANQFNNPNHAFITVAATNAMIDLGTLACAQTEVCNGSSYGTAINDGGQVTGYSTIATSTDTYHAFITNATTNALTDLSGSCGGCMSAGYGINTSGQVTGWAAFKVYPHAFVTNAATNVMTDLGTLGGTSSIGYGINARGEVAGQSSDSGNAAEHAFLYYSGKMHDLGTLGGTTSESTGINDNGQVTGWSDTSAGVQHAFLYSNSQLLDLNSEIGSASILYTVISAQGINDGGQIVANGIVNATGEDVALLLTPTAITTSTTLSLSAGAATYGSSVTLEALVSASRGGVPTGRVGFYAGSDLLGSVNIGSDGHAMLATAALRVGEQSLTATYSGSALDLASTSGALPLNVSQAPTTTALVVSPVHGASGTLITLTATVAATAGTAIPIGKVVFKDGTMTLATVALVAGTANYTIATLVSGKHSITAHFNGSVDELDSISPAVVVTIT